MEEAKLGGRQENVVRVRNSAFSFLSHVRNATYIRGRILGRF